MTTPFLCIDQLCRQAGGKCIVNAISLDVYASDLIAVIGRSEAGKSALLRLDAQAQFVARAVRAFKADTEAKRLQDEFLAQSTTPST